MSSSSGGARTTGPSAKKANARAKAAAAREAQLKAEKRRRIVIAIVAAAVAIGLIVTVVLVVMQSKNDTDGVKAVPGPTSSDGPAIVEGEASAPVRVDVFQDYMCPGCGALHAQSGSVFTEEAAAGTAVIHFHTLSFLDRFSQGTQYSTRAANAAACSADAGVFVKYNDLLYDNQPKENSTGLSNEQLISLGKEAGATSDEFAACVNDGKYTDWVAYVTDQAYSSNVSQTPTVRIDGKDVTDLSPDGLRKAIQDAAAAK